MCRHSLCAQHSSAYAVSLGSRSTESPLTSNGGLDTHHLTKINGGTAGCCFNDLTTEGSVLALEIYLARSIHFS